MTIITTQSRVSYAGDGTSTVFPIPFEFFLNSDIAASKAAVGGAVSTLVLGIDYALNGAGTPGGGSAIKTTPLLSGETLAFFLNPPITQASHYQSNAEFPASTLENDIDRQTQISQRLSDRLGRVFSVPDADLNPLLTFPSAAVRANTAPIFDSQGNVGVGIIPTTALTQVLFNGFLSAAPVGGVQTTAEIVAGVTPVNFQASPGNLLRYGANSVPGTTDMTAAIAAAISQALAGGAPVVVPPGIFLYTSAITKTLGAGSVDFFMSGAGGNASELRCSAVSGGLGFLWTSETNTVHIRDIAFTTTQVGGGTAITLFYGGAFGSILSLSDIQNCVFRGSDGYNVTNYWTNAIVQNVVSALNVDNCTFVGQGTFGAGGNNCHGTGIVLESSTGAAAPSVLTNVTRCDFQNLHVGINYQGFYQGLSVLSNNMVDCDIGISQPANQVSDAELNVVASQFACNFNISLQSGIVGTTLNSNYFISTFAGDVAVFIAGQYDFSINGNYFQALSNASNITAISVNTVPIIFASAPTAGATAGTIAAPLIYANGQAFNIVTSTGQGLRAFFTGLGNANLSWFPAITGSPTTAATLTGGSGVIQGNVIDNYSVGINLNPNTANLLVTANVFNTPGAILIANQATQSVAAFFVPNVVTGNPQSPNPAAGTLTLSSGAAFTNSFGCNVLVYVEGGTTTAATTVNGKTVAASGATNFSTVLPAGGTITATWSSAPTFTYTGL